MINERKAKLKKNFLVIIGSAEALPILCVRYIRWEREREIQRERERERERERRKWRHHCRAKIGDEFCTSPCQKFAPQFLPSWMALSSHFPLPKTLHFSKQFAFFALSNGVIDRGSKQESKRSNFRLHRSSFSSKKSKNWIKLIPKTIGNRKRDCAWGCAWGINTTWENLQIEKHKSGKRWFRSPNWFVLFDLQIFSGGVYSPSATSRTISFSISNSFWY